MTKTTKVQQAALDQLAEKREDAARQLTRLRAAIHSEVGWLPKSKTWILPLAGLACGLALALALGRGKSR